MRSVMDATGRCCGKMTKWIERGAFRYCDKCLAKFNARTREQVESSRWKRLGSGFVPMEIAMTHPAEPPTLVMAPLQWGLHMYLPIETPEDARLFLTLQKERLARLGYKTTNIALARLMRPHGSEQLVHRIRHGRFNPKVATLRSMGGLRSLATIAEPQAGPKLESVT